MQEQHRQQLQVMLIWMGRQLLSDLIGKGLVTPLCKAERYSALILFDLVCLGFKYSQDLLTAMYICAL